MEEDAPGGGGVGDEDQHGAAHAAAVAAQEVHPEGAAEQFRTRDQLRILWLAYAVAGRIVEDPMGVLARARENLDKMRSASPRGAAKIWLQQWSDLLAGPIEGVLAALTSPSPRSRELRQNTPFAGVLTEEQRKTALQGFAGAFKGPVRS